MASRVAVPEGVVFRDLDGEIVLLNLNSGIYFGLDQVGTRLWHWLANHRALTLVLAEMLREFDLDETTGRVDLLHFVETLRQKGLLEIVHEQAV